SRSTKFTAVPFGLTNASNKGVTMRLLPVIARAQAATRLQYAVGAQTTQNVRLMSQLGLSLASDEVF
ncbi:MAG: hypothetical protein RLZZ123_1962, partial [Pseudomonadota bacterium]